MTDNFKKVVRASLGKHPSLHTQPDLLEIQLKSYASLFARQEASQLETLEDIFRKYFPVENQYCRIEYLGLKIDESVYPPEFCKNNFLSYNRKITARFQISKTQCKEQDQVADKTIYNALIGDMPALTQEGTFIINGYEKVVVIQITRAPGILFTLDKDKCLTARIIPYTGSWLDFICHKDVIYTRIDKKKKIPATILLSGLGYSAQEILETFYQKIKVKIIDSDDGFKVSILPECLTPGMKLPFALICKGKVVLGEFEEITETTHQQLSHKDISCNADALVHTRLLERVDIEDSTYHINTKVTVDLLTVLASRKDLIVELAVDHHLGGRYDIANTLELAKSHGVDDQISSLVVLCNLVKGQDTVNSLLTSQQYDKLQQIYKDLFFSSTQYSLSVTGRLKLNYKLGTTGELDYLTGVDMVKTISRLLSIYYQEADLDSAEGLDNKIVKTASDHVRHMFNWHVQRASQHALETIAKYPSYESLPKAKELFTLHALGESILDFFKHGNLSQFLEHNNDLAKLSHKRRVTCLGPGGPSRSWSGPEVRDADPTSYSRICAVETPEGVNVGLINALAYYAKIDEYGFLSSAFMKMDNRKCTGEIVYLNAIEEKGCKIGARSLPMDEHHNLLPGPVQCRFNREIVVVDSEELTHIDVATNQMLSVSSSLIPFIERNDTKRSLMGANMQRQALPLCIKEMPLVGTGIEHNVARDAGAYIRARREGEVVAITAEAILVLHKGEIDIYPVKTFSINKNKSYLHDEVCVNLGQTVQTDDILAEGPCSQNGEISLGTNLKVAFLSLDGYNFEDSIVASSEILEKESLNSIHVHELVCDVHETPIGREETTSDLPNVTADMVKHLDESGLVRVGAEVKPGDILVGKITPKPERDATAEDRLLKAIFGDKISSVADSSMRVPSHLQGVVTEIDIIYRDQTEGDNMNASHLIFHEKNIYHYLDRLMPGKFVLSDNIEDIEKNYKRLTREASKNGKLAHILEQVDRYRNHRLLFKSSFKRKVLENTILERISIKIVSKGIIQPGDKLTSRHGNKGTISKIFPVADMPYLEDGSSVDLIFTPLGIPSRMNIGQLFEANLGLISQYLGRRIEHALNDPCALRKELDSVYNKILGSKLSLDHYQDEDLVAFAKNLIPGVPLSCAGFDSLDYSQLEEIMMRCGFEKSGNFQLYDGKTGEALDSKTCVGVLYCLKLDHMVETKIHARSTGPYSLITKQPLSGRSCLGGQRLGEMECWALESYGVSEILHEMLTVKSDDIEGRNKMYSNIFAGKLELPSSSAPESYKVLKNKLRSLSISLEELHLKQEEPEPSEPEEVITSDSAQSHNESGQKDEE